MQAMQVGAVPGSRLALLRGEGGGGDGVYGKGLGATGSATTAGWLLCCV
jgi:hypothetical protein